MNLPTNKEMIIYILGTKGKTRQEEGIKKTKE